MCHASLHWSAPRARFQEEGLSLATCIRIGFTLIPSLMAVLDIFIGYAIGGLAVGIHNLTHFLSHFRTETFKDAISQESAWLINTGIMLLYLTPALIGVLWQPAAGSSGVPGIVATLNGCDLPNTLTVQVWIARVLALSGDHARACTPPANPSKTPPSQSHPVLSPP